MLLLKTSDVTASSSATLDLLRYLRKRRKCVNWQHCHDRKWKCHKNIHRDVKPLLLLLFSANCSNSQKRLLVVLPTFQRAFSLHLLIPALITQQQVKITDVTLWIFVPKIRLLNRHLSQCSSKFFLCVQRQCYFSFLFFLFREDRLVVTSTRAVIRHVIWQMLCTMSKRKFVD